MAKYSSSPLAVKMASIAGNLVLEGIPFEYYQGTNAMDEDRIEIFCYSIYVLDNGEIYMTDGYDRFYYDEVEEFMTNLKLGIEENL